jgi:hypothetical protein
MMNTNASNTPLGIDRFQLVDCFPILAAQRIESIKPVVRD